ncbi:MAG TPA: FkbM family methyltransferase [Flavisolibacter sp.]|jgi:FkbM family methyltransferase|nr:FkbM family methyltransferase [Flavisolibacter sp.]
MNLFSRRKKATSPVFPKEIFTNKIDDLKPLPHGIPGGIDIYDHRFYFHDARCFYDSYLEILHDEIYKFKPTSAKPLIIDCGANMGVSVIYFAKEHPAATIVAFEPEEGIYEVLQKNIASYGLTNVDLHKKAVWDAVTVLEFTTDHGMGGSVANTFSNQAPVKVETVRLADYLTQPVDFLKLDIEGAEYTVLKDCEPLLKNVQNLFVEYHSFVHKEQKLEEILAMLKQAGFRYHLKQSFSQQRPFVDRLLACENMDMAITVFAYREA